jgi:hypothetical protein
MKLRFLTVWCICVIFLTNLTGQVTLDYYLPQDITYDKNIPTPKDFLGYEVGQWHVGHDQLVYYMKALANASDRVTIEEFARTYEGRPLVLLTITSPGNHKNIKEIQEQHVDLTNPDKSSKLNVAKMPVVTYQGYSIHGNEASGSNAALLYAYYLAAAQGDAIEKILENTVILLNPSFNPDGLNRFASWVNTHKSHTTVSDADEREFNEAWPGGRTNHYWFDLNRDWLPTQHPESQGYVKSFHAWKPNVLTDHHEMGTNNTFFFQPGIPSCTHPLTPKRNQELTGKIGEYHAKFLDNIGSLYYTKEDFDDYYYGKGSTYPDANGSIGILFEQASSRGHAQESVHGILTFPFTIRNQFQTSLSTLQAAYELKNDLLDWQREFYKTAMTEASSDGVKGIVFGDKFDKTKTAHFIEMLHRHQIKVYKNTATINSNRESFGKEDSYIIPFNQPQYRLVKAIFEQRTTFEDSLFYDVSGFNLALAFDMPYGEIKGAVPNLGDLVTIPPFPVGKVNGEKSEYAYIFRWDEYYTPRALNEILSSGLMAKVTNLPFTIATENGNQAFGVGTIMVAVARQPMESEELFAFLKEVAKRNHIEIFSLKTGMSSQGISLGSPNWSPLTNRKTLIVVDGNVTSYDAGEVWHLFDQRYNMPITKIAQQDFDNASLDRYNTIIMVSGNYKADNVERLKTWLRKGNTLIVYRDAIRWAKNNGLANVEFKSKASANLGSERPYDKREADSGSRVIGGAIGQTRGDLTNPLLYGYHRETLPVLRRGTLFLEPSSNIYATPLRYTSTPLLNGYISSDNLKTMKNSASIVVSNMGDGKVICMADNTNFRAFWYGTNKLLMNAVFFGATISSGAAQE